MTLKELRARLLDEIQDRLASEGYRRSEQTFVRPVPVGAYLFHVAFMNHRADFDVSADVGIRYDEFESRLGRRDKATATIGAQLENIAGDGVRRWTVQKPSDVSAVSEGIIARFHHIGVPFLERFGSPHNVLEVLSRGGREAVLICPLSDRRIALIDALRAKFSPAPPNTR